MKLHIGLTGGIGSGKSTVAACMVALGATLVDTDAIARQLTLPGGSAIEPIRRAFGDAMIDTEGALDRPRMRSVAFADPTARRRLEEILHPLIGIEARRQADAAGSGPVVFDVPLLAESSVWRARCHRIVVVDCDEATQLRRVRDRSGWPEAQVKAVMAQQITRAQRRAIADAVVHNGGSIAALDAQVTALWRVWSVDSALRMA